jgi:hypothetical protein
LTSKTLPGSSPRTGQLLALVQLEKETVASLIRCQSLGWNQTG